jgi:hypothetical protein
MPMDEPTAIPSRQINNQNKNMSIEEPNTLRVHALGRSQKSKRAIKMREKKEKPKEIRSTFHHARNDR